VAGRNCVIMDDMVDTANTLCEAAAALKAQGAKKVLAYATHPILSGAAAQRIADSALDELVVTNTIPLDRASSECKKIRQLSAAGLIAETIKRISQEESVSSLFMD
jgi:ribose-phosphate pyrophosphokinase